MILRAMVLTLALGALALSACSKKGIDPALCGPANEGVTAACHLPDGTCWELYCKSLNDNGVCFAEDEQFRDRDSCEVTQKGQWSLTCPCLRESSTGGCRTVKEEGRSLTKWTYAGLTVEQHRSVCETSAYNTFLGP